MKGYGQTETNKNGKRKGILEEGSLRRKFSHKAKRCAYLRGKNNWKKKVSEKVTPERNE